MRTVTEPRGRRKMIETIGDAPIQSNAVLSNSSYDSGVDVADNTVSLSSSDVTLSSTHINNTRQQQQQHSNDQELNRNVNISNNQIGTRNVLNANKVHVENFINNLRSTNDGSAPNNRLASNNVSPALSQRSASISITSIDEYALNSSTVDSESECDADQSVEDRVHSDYIVKRLGQQTTYAPHSPDIAKITAGATTLRRQFDSSHGAELPSLPTDLLQGRLGTGQFSKAAPSVPQIGSVALTNSSDVTFGDKHFYEGPVTIQQFLIDSNGGQKHVCPDHQQDSPSSSTNNATESPTARALHPQQPGKFAFKRRMLIVIGVVALLILLSGVVIVIASNAFNDSARTSKRTKGDDEGSRKNIPIDSNIGRDNIGGGKILRIVPRDAWLAQPPTLPPVDITLPVPLVIVTSTQTETCDTQAACTYRVRFIQTFNIESTRNNDIIYNFLIGADGNVYEGRGWNHQGAHLTGYNHRSISFAYIGTYRKTQPNAKQLNVTRLLLDEGVSQKKLSPDYKITGAGIIEPESLFARDSALYSNFAEWPHWSNSCTDLRCN